MQKIWLFVCLLALLGSQGIVVKCKAAIFFRTVDCTHRDLLNGISTLSLYLIVCENVICLLDAVKV